MTVFFFIPYTQWGCGTDTKTYTPESIQFPIAFTTEIAVIGGPMVNRSDFSSGATATIKTEATVAGCVVYGSESSTGFDFGAYYPHKWFAIGK